MPKLAKEAHAASRAYTAVVTAGGWRFTARPAAYPWGGWVAEAWPPRAVLGGGGWVWAGWYVTEADAWRAASGWAREQGLLEGG